MLSGTSCGFLPLTPLRRCPARACPVPELLGRSFPSFPTVDFEPLAPSVPIGAAPRQSTVVDRHCM